MNIFTKFLFDWGFDPRDWGAEYRRARRMARHKVDELNLPPEQMRVLMRVLTHDYLTKIIKETFEDAFDDVERVFDNVPFVNFWQGLMKIALYQIEWQKVADTVVEYWQPSENNERTS